MTDGVVVLPALQLCNYLASPYRKLQFRKKF